MKAKAQGKCMIWRILIIIMLHLVVAACSSGPTYQRHVNQAQRGKPLIHPVDFPVCPAGEWGTVFVPLGIVVYRGFLPKLEAVTELAKQFPERNPCETIQQTNPAPGTAYHRNQRPLGGRRRRV